MKLLEEWIKTVREKPLQSLPGLYLLVGLILIVICVIRIDAKDMTLEVPDLLKHHILIMGITSILIGACLSIAWVWKSSQQELDRKDYAYSMKKGDLDQAVVIQRRHALRKLRSNRVSEAIIGAREVAELGSQEPFERGFRELVRQLHRRHNWELKFVIVEALYRVMGPLRSRYE
jgi:hypothetical protein